MCVDASFINQDDNVEKAQQVSRRCEVYAVASNVVAFLSSDHDLTGNMHLERRDTLVREQSNPTLFDLVGYVQSHAQGSPWHGLFSLLQMSWFSRIGVVQDALMARKLSIRRGTA